MKLSVKNIGIIKEGKIELDGITVLSGENATGKSTLGKVLFCCSQTFYHVEEKLKNEYKEQVLVTLIRYLRTSNASANDYLSDKTASDIIDYYNTHGKVHLPEEIFDKGTNAEKERIRKKVEEVLKVEAMKVVQRIFTRTMNAEFGEQSIPVNNPKRKLSIEVEWDSGKKLQIAQMLGKEPNINEIAEGGQDVIFIDDPCLLDYVSGRRNIFYFFSRFSHQSDLLRKLERNTDHDSVIQAILAEKELHELEILLQKMCDGELISDSQNRFIYSSDSLKKPLSIESLSTGMKSVLLLKMLLSNGRISDSSILVFDEPEVHLHPEWQFKLARVLILIPKVFDVKLLISTHSTDFLSAIDYYSKEYEMSGKTRYYLMEKEENYSVARDVTTDLEQVYYSLGRPFLRVAEKL